MHLHVLLILLAALAIGVLSAGIRHVESGLACTDRGSCYGQIGHTQASAPEMQTAPAWTKRGHRLLAGALVLLTLALVYRTRAMAPASRAVSIIPLLMIALLLALAIIGPLSHLKTRPIIATFNLVGGAALVALGWQLLLVLGASEACRASTNLRRVVRFALLLLAAQIVSGAWVSANFAGLACHGVPGCTAEAHAASAPLVAALSPLRELTLDPTGRVSTDASALTINLVHRIGALLTALVLGIACLGAAHARIPARLWLPVAALLILQCALGVAAITSTLALPVTLAHGLVSTLLLLGTMRFDHVLQPTTTGDTR